MCCFFSSVGIQHLTVSSSLYIFTPLMENFRDTGRLLLHVWGKMSIECVTVFQSAGHSCCHSNRKVLFCSVLPPGVSAQCGAALSGHPDTGRPREKILRTVHTVHRHETYSWNTTHTMKHGRHRHAKVELLYLCWPCHRTVVTHRCFAHSVCF